MVTLSYSPLGAYISRICFWWDNIDGAPEPLRANAQSTALRSSQACGLFQCRAEAGSGSNRVYLAPALLSAFHDPCTASLSMCISRVSTTLMVTHL